MIQLIHPRKINDASPDAIESILDHIYWTPYIVMLLSFFRLDLSKILYKTLKSSRKIGDVCSKY